MNVSKKLSQPAGALLSRNGRFLVQATWHISGTLSENALDFDNVRYRKRQLVENIFSILKRKFSGNLKAGIFAIRKRKLPGK
jgi:hypothetical protein